MQLTCDLKWNRWFKLGTRRFDISATGTNIFNNLGITRVDPFSGTGLVWGDGRYDARSYSGLNDFTRVGTVDNPSNYSGSQWRMQLDVDL
jgi:hypothetical protein